LADSSVQQVPGYRIHRVEKEGRRGGGVELGTLKIILNTKPERLQEKKFLSAEPTGVGRFLLSKFLILTFTRVNIGLRRKL